MIEVFDHFRLVLSEGNEDDWLVIDEFDFAI